MQSDRIFPPSPAFKKGAFLLILLLVFNFAFEFLNKTTSQLEINSHMFMQVLFWQVLLWYVSFCWQVSLCRYSFGRYRFWQVSFFRQLPFQQVLFWQVSFCSFRQVLFVHRPQNLYYELLSWEFSNDSIQTNFSRPITLNFVWYHIILICLPEDPVNITPDVSHFYFVSGPSGILCATWFYF